MRITNRWIVGEWTFREVQDHGFGDGLTDKPLYGFTTDDSPVTSDGHPRIGEYYRTIEHAMAAAIAEKHTGRRGAGGSGVGTAADWFMRMIGVPAEPAPKADAGACPHGYVGRCTKCADRHGVLRALRRVHALAYEDAPDLLSIVEQVAREMGVKL